MEGERADSNKQNDGANSCKINTEKIYNNRFFIIKYLASN